MLVQVGRREHQLDGTRTSLGSPSFLRVNSRGRQVPFCMFTDPVCPDWLERNGGQEAGIAWPVTKIPMLAVAFVSAISPNPK
jgi:hypothetical protein